MKAVTCGVKARSPFTVASVSTTGSPDPPALSALSPAAEQPAARRVTPATTPSLVHRVMSCMVLVLPLMRRPHLVPATLGSGRTRGIVATAEPTCGQHGDATGSRGPTMTSMLTRGTPRSAWWGTVACVVLGLAVAASGWGALAVAQGPGHTDDVRRVLRPGRGPDDREWRRARSRRPAGRVRRLAQDRGARPGRRPDLVRAHVGGLGAGPALDPQHRHGRRRLLPAGRRPRRARLSQRPTTRSPRPSGGRHGVRRGDGRRDRECPVPGPFLRSLLLVQLHGQHLRGPLPAGPVARGRGGRPVVRRSPRGGRDRRVRRANGGRLAVG